MTTMKLITKMVPTTTTAMGTGTVPVTAITEVTVIPETKGGSAEWKEFLIPSANRSVWCYGKDQSILVNNIEKKN